MRATVITSVMFSLYGLAVTGVEGVATIDRGNTVELTPGMTPGHLAVHRGPSPGVIDPSLDPLLDSTNDNTGDWLDVPDAIQWGYINDNHEAHGLVDVVWAFEGVPSFDGHKYNFLSQDTLDLLELLATVNADLPQPPNLPGQDPDASPNNARRQIQSSLTGRATTYACTTKFQPRRAELRLPRRQGHPRSQPVLAIQHRQQQSLINTSRPGWTNAFAYQMIADAIPIIDNCWNGVNPCGVYRRGVSQASNTWPKTCVCNNNSQGSC